MRQTSTNPAVTERSSGLVRIMHSLERLVAFLTKTSLAFAGLTLIAILLMISYSVVWRYFFNTPQPWVDESTGWLLVMAVMLSLPEVQRRNDHIGIDFLHQTFKGKVTRVLLFVGVLTVLISSVIIVIEGIRMVQFSHMLGVLSNQIPEVPLWAVQMLVPIGFALMALVAAVQFACLCVGVVPQGMRESLHGELA